MRHQPARNQPTVRGALAGASALILLGALATAAFDLAGPTRREVAVERAAVRQLTATLAKAVRGMVGQERPAAALPAGITGPWRAVVALAAPLGPEHAKGHGERLRHELLDLPPPALAS